MHGIGGLRRGDGIWVRGGAGERGSGISKRAYIVQSKSDMKIKLKRGISRPPSCSPRRQDRKIESFDGGGNTYATPFLHSSSVRDFVLALSWTHRMRDSST